jgi:hypothetical protein
VDLSFSLNGSIVVASVISGTLIGVIWVPDVGKLGLSLSNVALSSKNIVIKTEVWNEIILRMALWSLEAGNEDVSETCFGGTNMSLGISDIDVLWSKVWHEIVFWMTLWSLERSAHNVTESGLGGSDMVLSISDINILRTEVWNKVVDWVSLWLLERCLELVAKFTLSVSDVSLGSGDVNILWAEVRNKVVNLPGWLIPAGVGCGFVPWSRTFWWSIIDLCSFAIL